MKFHGVFDALYLITFSSDGCIEIASEDLRTVRILITASPCTSTVKKDGIMNITMALLISTGLRVRIYLFLCQLFFLVAQ
jgi:hypothetical protein